MDQTPLQIFISDLALVRSNITHYNRAGYDKVWEELFRIGQVLIGWTPNTPYITSVHCVPNNVRLEIWVSNSLRYIQSSPLYPMIKNLYVVGYNKGKYSLQDNHLTIDRLLHSIARERLGSTCDNLANLILTTAYYYRIELCYWNPKSFNIAMIG